MGVVAIFTHCISCARAGKTGSNPTNLKSPSPSKISQGRYPIVDSTADVRFGSLAVINCNSSLMTAFGGKADVRNAEIH